MRSRQKWLVVIVGGLVAATLSAQDQSTKPQEKPAATTSEVIVVTASRTEQPLNEAPASLSVLDQKTIESIPADNYGDLLRNVPGLNVSQTSARDINITSRGATNTLATSELVMVDGRSLYLDFFGFVMWDFLPVDPVEIKQIEVVNGPGSAVWGANAMTGVVNVITKRPKEIVGTSILLGGGEIGTKYGSVTNAGVSGNFGYKVSAGYYEQDAFERPTGPVPGSNPPATYPDFKNQGTKQPKGDVRLDWDLTEDSYFDIQAGRAQTSGIIQTGIGPFQIDNGTKLTYGKIDYDKQSFHIGTFWNGLDADSKNLYTRGADGNPLGFAFKTNTYDIDLANTSVAGSHHIFTYGADYRHSTFDLQIAPQGTRKNEWGAFVQDEMILGDHWRWVVGGRYDDVDPISGVFTPRTSLMYSPRPNHTFRVSYNKAFRSPSVINDYLNVVILNQATVPVGGVPVTVYIPALATGDVALSEEQLTAYEVGYVGTLHNGMIVTLSAYRNETKNTIDFYVSGLYGPGNLPMLPPPFNAVVPCFNYAPGTLPAAVCPLGGLAGIVPSNFSYRNLQGKQVDRGVELSLQKRFSQDWSWFFNGSWQDKPTFDKSIDVLSQNIPPEWRGNAGFSFDPGPWFVSANVNYQDKAYWADVLNIRAYTDAFTTLNATIGVRLLDERMTIELRGTNLTDKRLQQHIFGDIIARKITGQIGFRF